MKCIPVLLEIVSLKRTLLKSYGIYLVGIGAPTYLRIRSAPFVNRHDLVDVVHAVTECHTGNKPLSDAFRYRETDL